MAYGPSQRRQRGRDHSPQGSQRCRSRSLPQPPTCSGLTLPPWVIGQLKKGENAWKASNVYGDLVKDEDPAYGKAIFERILEWQRRGY